MRVTTRRLRSTLQSFGEVIPRSGNRGMMAGLKWLGGVLGEARDAEVLASRLAATSGRSRPSWCSGRSRRGCRGTSPRFRRPRARTCWPRWTRHAISRCATRWTNCWLSPPLAAEAARPAGRVLPAAARRTYRRTRRRIAAPGIRPRARPETSPITRPGRRPSGPGTRGGDQPRPGQAGQALHQADEEDPVGARRPSGRGGGPGRGPGTRHQRAPGGRERVHLRAAVRAGRRAGGPAAGEAQRTWKRARGPGSAIGPDKSSWTVRRPEHPGERENGRSRSGLPQRASRA